MIYGMAMHRPRESYCYLEDPDTIPTEPGRVVAFINSYYGPRRTKNPPLLHASRQLRSESGKVYFGRRSFQMCIDTESRSTGTEHEAVTMWLKTIVGSSATHLTDVRVHFHGEDSETTIRARFCQSRGLQITGSIEYYVMHEHDGRTRLLRGIPAYVAALEENRIARGQKGKVIRDFFVDWNAFLVACYGPKQRWATPGGTNGPGGPDYGWVDCGADDARGRLWGYDDY
jgi:hypothetical protein